MPSWKSARPATVEFMNEDDVTREELHLRQIEMRGWRRSDGLFEVEGRLTDRKPHDTVVGRGQKLLPAREPLHDMGVRIVYDAQMRVHDVQTFTQAAPYAQCPEGGRALRSLIGQRMVNGWSKVVRERIGGSRSCTHLMQLLSPMATVAMQSLGELRKNEPELLDANGRPVKIDSCYAYGAERELVHQLWPQFHRPAPPEQG